MLERTQRLQIFQVADVLADEGFLFTREADGVLEFGPGPQDRRDGLAQENRLGRISSCAANRADAPRKTLLTESSHRR